MWAKVPETQRGCTGNTSPGATGRFYGISGSYQDSVNKANILQDFFDPNPENDLESPNNEAMDLIKEMAPQGVSGNWWWGFAYYVNVVGWEGPVYNFGDWEGSVTCDGPTCVIGETQVCSR
jgi:hypothetical protein